MLVFGTVCLSILGTRNLNSKCGQSSGHGGLGKNLFLVSRVFGLTLTCPASPLSSMESHCLLFCVFQGALQFPLTLRKAFVIEFVSAAVSFRTGVFTAPPMFSCPLPELGPEFDHSHRLWGFDLDVSWLTGHHSIHTVFSPLELGRLIAKMTMTKTFSFVKFGKEK